MPRPKDPEILEPRVQKRFTDTDSIKLAPAIASIEGVDVITETVLDTLGMGTVGGLVLSQCTGAADTAAARVALSVQLLTADKRLRKLGTGATPDLLKRTALLAIGRMVTALVARAAAANGGGGLSPGGGVINVVTQSEEDRSMTLNAFTTDDMASLTTVAETMYNFRYHPFELPPFPACKKIAYHLKQFSWPDPDRVGLEQMRLLATEYGLELHADGAACKRCDRSSWGSAPSS